MHLSQYKTLANGSVKNALPPITGVYNSSRNQFNNVGELCGVSGSQASSSGMVSQNNRSVSSKSLIYRSIPPKPHTFTLSDMIGDSLTPQKGPATKKLGLSGSSSSEFAKRFMSRPTTQPKVVEFNVGKMNGQKRRRGINGFFPPVKLRGHSSAKVPPQTAPPPEPTHIVAMSAPPPIPTATTTTTTNPGSALPPEFPLQLVPTSYSEVRPKSASRSISRASRTSRASRLSIRRTPESIIRMAPAIDSNIIYPETFEFDDSHGTLPSPKKVLPKRDVPWVFRYKVKRNMNELSKILAHKNPQLVDV